jgi:hypothetical protein
MYWANQTDPRLSADRRTKNSRAHMFWMSFLLSLFYFGAVSSTGSGTTIVAVRAPNFVVLGADSLVAAMGNDKGAPLLGCKIIQDGKVFVGVAGIFADNRGSEAYDLAKRALRRSANMISGANQFEKLARVPFRRLIRRFRRENPTKFSKYCNNRECLEVVFATIENGIPTLAVRGFLVSGRGRKVRARPAKHVDCPGQGCPTGAMQIVLGDNLEANNLFDKSPHFWRDNGLIPGMEKLINVEIAANRDDVGGPISIILLVDKKGVQWLPGHQGVCPAIGHE